MPPTFAGNATKQSVELAHWLATAASKVDFVSLMIPGWK